MGKNFVSDGHFCKSFCPASHKISISGDFRHCCRVMIYLDCVMSNNYDLLQNKSLRNRLIIAASVMEFISTTPKNEQFEKILPQNQPKTTNFINWWTYKYQFPVDKPARLTIRVLWFLFLIVRRVPRPSESGCKKCNGLKKYLLGHTFS